MADDTKKPHACPWHRETLLRLAELDVLNEKHASLQRAYNDMREELSRARHAKDQANYRVRRLRTCLRGALEGRDFNAGRAAMLEARLAVAEREVRRLRAASILSEWLAPSWLTRAARWLRRGGRAA